MENIIIGIISMFVLYIVIETAVRKGIDHSELSTVLLEKHNAVQEKKKGFLDKDIDSE
ncbi:MAG: hypothetical protein ACRCWQ_01460 [Bacilli bacterium]